ncbi:MAG: YraN family protein [Lachnospiraceae bacterium]|nr:YraN family protein [Lachnospiraceae bacterium]
MNKPTNKSTNKKELGKRGETLAGKLLTLHGYKILQYNYRCKKGEVDIIAMHGDYLVFVEVKYREENTLCDPQTAVNKQKQHRISGCAAWYLKENHYPMDTAVRFDVVAIKGKQYQIFQDAFMYQG